MAFSVCFVRISGRLVRKLVESIDDVNKMHFYLFIYFELMPYYERWDRYIRFHAQAENVSLDKCRKPNTTRRICSVTKLSFVMLPFFMLIFVDIVLVRDQNGIAEHKMICLKLSALSFIAPSIRNRTVDRIKPKHFDLFEICVWIATHLHMDAIRHSNGSGLH